MRKCVEVSACDYAFRCLCKTTLDTCERARMCVWSNTRFHLTNKVLAGVSIAHTNKRMRVLRRADRLLRRCFVFFLRLVRVFTHMLSSINFTCVHARWLTVFMLYTKLATHWFNNYTAFTVQNLPNKPPTNRSDRRLPRDPGVYNVIKHIQLLPLSLSSHT